jgi:hypothetical protein
MIIPKDMPLETAENIRKMDPVEFNRFCEIAAEDNLANNLMYALNACMQDKDPNVNG